MDESASAVAIPHLVADFAVPQRPGDLQQQQQQPVQQYPTVTAGGVNIVPNIIPNDGTPLVHMGRKAPVLPWPNIGGFGKWSVSSFKFGFGAECLSDDDPDTFWHSDGPQPHFITVEFPSKVSIQKLSIYLCFPLDDSYTPSTMCVRAGTGPADLQDVRVVTLEKPDGWITFDISSEPNEDGEGFKAVQAYILQVIVLANHMNGKDTHIRGLRILGPEDQEPDLDGSNDPFPWSSSPFKMYKQVR